MFYKGNIVRCFGNAGYMDQIMDQTNYLSKTIDDFRNFIKGGNTEETLNISSVLNQTFSIVNPALQSNYITIIKDIDVIMAMKGYENELMQAFINIINNAKDVLVANENLENKYIFIDVKQIDNQCEIIIKDNGGGIMISIINRIFEPYFTTKHKSRGTGLGLSMAYKIVTEMHNGTIIASNVTYEYNGEKYTGACFTMTFNSPFSFMKELSASSQLV